MSEQKAVTVLSGFSALEQMGSPELVARMQEVKDNLGTVENVRIPRIKMTADGAQIVEDEEPVEALEGVIIHARKQNVYYEKPYRIGQVEAPTCFSHDGVKPDASIAKPVNKTCLGCPMAEFGTNQMKSGKACRNLKPLYLLMSDESIMPRQLTVTPTGLKAANKYFMDLTERGVSYRKVRTRIEFYKENAGDTYMKMRFKMLGKIADAGRLKDIEALRMGWLPAMENQAFDRSEIETEAQPTASAPVDTKGEF